MSSVTDKLFIRRNNGRKGVGCGFENSFVLTCAGGKKDVTGFSLGKTDLEILNVTSYLYFLPSCLHSFIPISATQRKLFELRKTRLRHARKHIHVITEQEKPNDTKDCHRSMHRVV
jgi:hypothetical protein